MAQKPKSRGPIENPKEIELLASPTRIEIVDTLESLGGEATVAELAAQLGRPADGLYYHLRQLAEGGLLVETATPEGRRYRTRVPEGERLRLRYRPGKNANAQAVGDVAASVLRVAGRDFKRAIADPDAVAAIGLNVPLSFRLSVPNSEPVKLTATSFPSLDAPLMSNG